MSDPYLEEQERLAAIPETTLSIVRQTRDLTKELHWYARGTLLVVAITGLFLLM
jgi:hypothetical protein